MNIALVAVIIFILLIPPIAFYVSYSFGRFAKAGPKFSTALVGPCGDIGGEEKGNIFCLKNQRKLLLQGHFPMVIFVAIFTVNGFIAGLNIYSGPFFMPGR